MPLTASLALGGLGLVQGMGQAKHQNQMNRQNGLANAAMMQYSPWSGIKTGFMPMESKSPIMAGLGQGAQGALSGAMFGQQFKGAPTGIDPEVQQNMNMLKGYNGQQSMTSGQSAKPSFFGTWSGVS